MLAGVTDYLAWWQLPVLAVMAAIWLWAAPYLLRRKLLTLQVRRARASVGRCVAAAFLSGLAGLVAGSVMFFLFRAIGQRWFREGLVWPAVAAAVASFALIGQIVLYAMVNLDFGTSLRAWTAAFGPAFLVLLLIGGPTAWLSYELRYRELDRQRCLKNLHDLYLAIRSHHPLRAPASLQQLVGRTVPPERVRCPAASSPGISYFYIPVPIQSPGPPSPSAPRRPLLACDFRDNHPDGRCVVRANGEAFWCTEREFDDLLALPENLDFAAALAAAEAGRALPTQPTQAAPRPR